MPRALAGSAAIIAREIALAGTRARKAFAAPLRRKMERHEATAAKLEKFHEGRRKISGTYLTGQFGKGAEKFYSRIAKQAAAERLKAARLRSLVGHGKRKQ